MNMADQARGFTRNREAVGAQFPGDTRREDRIIAKAMDILQTRLRVPGPMMDNRHDARRFVVLRLAELEHESFLALWLNNRHQLIATEELFRGTITRADVYPREVVKRALHWNAAAVIFAHNHPSGCAEPSLDDELITDMLVRALDLVAVRMLDHFVVGGTDAVCVMDKMKAQAISEKARGRRCRR